MLEAILNYKFLQNALVGSVLASIACGIIGTIIIEKKLVMMSGGIAHASFGGIGMGYFLRIEPIIGALIFSLAASVGIASLNKKTRTNADVIMGIFWSMGMAAGILFIAFTPGYPPDMSSYLFGDILTVSGTDLLFMLVLDLAAVFIATALFNYLRSYLFDEEFTTVLGINTLLLEYLVYILISITVVLLIRVVGIILVIALLTSPPAIAKMFTFDLKKIMVISVFLGLFFCMAGLWISYYLQIASGASIVLLAGISYIAVSIVKKSGLQKMLSKADKA